ncbi:substrate-binding domain-containing protein [Saccharothrix hoggarensis]
MLAPGGSGLPASGRRGRRAGPNGARRLPRPRRCGGRHGDHGSLPDTDATFALGDLPALGALDALRRAGIDVPGDVAVAGFDDLAFASLTEPALTTTSHPVEQIAGNAAVAVLERRAPSPSTPFPSILIHRDST